MKENATKSIVSALNAPPKHVLPQNHVQPQPMQQSKPVQPQAMVQPSVQVQIQPKIERPKPVPLQPAPALVPKQQKVAPTVISQDSNGKK